MVTSTLLLKGLNVVQYTALISWPLSRERSLVGHTYCDTEHPYIIFTFILESNNLYNFMCILTCIYKTVT